MRRFDLLAGLALAIILAPSALSAQLCSETSSVGPYTVDFSGASYDGTDTEFEYCITTDTYLDEWKLVLDPECLDASTITDCGPSSCGWDDSGGISGILFDALDIGPGETACFTFSLEGDWTDQVGEVQIRLKNDQGGNKVTDICGPICRICQADVEVDVQGDEASVHVGILHNKPPTVESELELTVTNHRGKRIRSWKSEPFLMEYGQVINYDQPIPGKALKPGRYTLVVALKGMSGWYELETRFEVE